MSIEMEAQDCEVRLDPSANDVDVERQIGRISIAGTSSESRLVYKGEQHFSMCRDQGSDPRFLVHEGNFPNVLDTLTGTRKNISFDFSQIAAINRPNEEHGVNVQSLCFLQKHQVLCLVILNDNHFLFDGEMDCVSCRTTIKSMIGFDEWSNRTFVVNNAKTQAYLLAQLGPDLITISEVQTVDNSLTIINTIRLHNKISCPTVHDDRLFGFRWRNGKVDTKRLIEVSLTDGTEIRHKIEVHNQIEDPIFNPFTYVGIKNSIFTAQYDRNSDVSTVVRFDLRELKWTRTNLEVEGMASELAVAGSVLTVCCVQHKEFDADFFCYQFHIDKVDSFSNLVWRSVHQYNHSNPLFTEWFVSKLPINTRFCQ